MDRMFEVVPESKDDTVSCHVASLEAPLEDTIKKWMPLYTSIVAEIYRASNILQNII